MNHYELGHATVLLSQSSEKHAGDTTLSYDLKGKLYLSRTGWLLMSIPNAIGRGAFDALNAVGAELPVSETTNQYNAHVSVMRPEEIESIGGAEQITERGHEMAYTLGNVRTVEPDGWPDMAKVWFINIRSPELEKLRKSYGLSALPDEGNKPFHMTFAVKRKNVTRPSATTKKLTDLIHKPSRLFNDGYSQKSAAETPRSDPGTEAAGASEVPRSKTASNAPQDGPLRGQVHRRVDHLADEGVGGCVSKTAGSRVQDRVDLGRLGVTLHLHPAEDTSSTPRGETATGCGGVGTLGDRLTKAAATVCAGAVGDLFDPGGPQGLLVRRAEGAVVQPSAGGRVLSGANGLAVRAESASTGAGRVKSGGVRVESGRRVLQPDHAAGPDSQRRTGPIGRDKQAGAGGGTGRGRLRGAIGTVLGVAVESVHSRTKVSSTVSEYAGAPTSTSLVESQLWAQLCQPVSFSDAADGTDAAGDGVRGKVAALGYAIRDSAIHGKGAFAGRAYGPADRIGPLGVRSKDGTITRSELGRAINHSPNPNTVLTTGSGGLQLVADEAIAADEELTLNYHEAYDTLGGDATFENGSTRADDIDLFDKKAAADWGERLKAQRKRKSQCPGCGKQFAPDEPYPDVENCEVCERFGSPKEKTAALAAALKENKSYDPICPHCDEVMYEKHFVPDRTEPKLWRHRGDCYDKGGFTITWPDQTEKQALSTKQLDSDASKTVEPKSPEQAEAGNYKKGRVKLHGMDIAIETAKGQERRGVDPSGKEWSVEMKHHYGDLKRTEGADGDSVDVFIGRSPESKRVFVVDQLGDKFYKASIGAKRRRRFDEHKCMLGFATEADARAGYLANYEKGWEDRIGAITEMSVDQFKAWVKDGDMTKPAKGQKLEAPNDQTQDSVVRDKAAVLDAPAAYGRAVVAVLHKAAGVVGRGDGSGRGRLRGAVHDPGRHEDVLLGDRGGAVAYPRDTGYGKAASVSFPRDVARRRGVLQNLAVATGVVGDGTNLGRTGLPPVVSVGGCQIKLAGASITPKEGQHHGKGRQTLV